MDQNYKHFPHPVLSSDRDDYIDSIFSVSLELDHITDKLRFRFSSTLENQEMERLIDGGHAKIIFRIESQQTMYREIFQGQVGNTEFYINENLIKGDILIESYILATKEIVGFQSKKFHSDYEDLRFDLSKGSILAIGEEFKRRINKDMEELYNIPSIFLISRVDEEKSEMKISLEGDKINIILSNEDYVNQQNISKLSKYQPILHSMIIMPALIYLFTDIQDVPEERFEELSEKRWFKSIDGVLRKMNLALDADHINRETPYKLAQLILGNPLNRALSALMIKDEGED